MRPREISDWKKLYEEQSVEKMPWYTPNLDGGRTVSVVAR